MDKHEAYERMQEIKDEIKQLVSEAEDIMREHASRHARNAAESYWLGHVLTALDDESRYVGKSMFTMQDTINSLEPCDEEVVSD
jgi:hypothetical protein